MVSLRVRTASARAAFVWLVVAILVTSSFGLPAPGRVTPRSSYAVTVAAAFEGDETNETLAFRALGNASIVVPVDETRVVRSVGVELSNYTQTDSLFPTCQWTATNQTDLTFRATSRGGWGSALNVTVTGDSSQAPFLPLNDTTGTEEFWTQGNWSFFPAPPDDVALDKEWGPQPSGGSNRVNVTLARSSVGTRTSAFTRRFYFSSSSVQNPSTLSFSYAIDNQGVFPLYLRVYLNLPGVGDVQVGTWQGTDTQGNWNAHQFGYATLRDYFTTPGWYNLTFKVTYTYDGSFALADPYVQVDHVYLNLTESKLRLPPGSTLAWDAKVSAPGTPAGNEVNVTLAYQVGEKLPGVDHPTSRLSFAVNGTWVDVANLTQVQPHVDQVVNLTFPSSLFSGTHVEVSVGVRLGEDAWEIYPGQSFFASFFGFECKYLTKRAAEELPWLTSVRAVVSSDGSGQLNFSLASVNATTASFTFNNERATTWDVGRPATLYLNATSAPLGFSCDVTVRTWTTTWRSLAFELANEVIGAASTHVDHVTAAAAAILESLNEDGRDKLANALGGMPTGAGAWDDGVPHAAAYLGPLGTKVVGAVARTLDRAASGGLLDLPRFNDSVHHVAPIAQQIADLGPGNPVSPVLEADFATLRSSLDVARSAIRGVLSSTPPAALTANEASALVHDLRSLSSQLLQVIRGARGTAFAPATTSFPEGRAYPATALSRLGIASATSSSPWSSLWPPLSSTAVASTGLELLSPASFLPLVLSSENSSLAAPFLADFHADPPLAGFLALVSCEAERVAWWDFPNHLEAFVTETLGGQLAGGVGAGSPGSSGNGQASLNASVDAGAPATGGSGSPSSSEAALAWSANFSGGAAPATAWLVHRQYYTTSVGPFLAGETLRRVVLDSGVQLASGSFVFGEEDLTTVAFLANASGAQVVGGPVVSLVELVANGRVLDDAVVTHAPGWTRDSPVVEYVKLESAAQRVQAVLGSAVNASFVATLPSFSFANATANVTALATSCLDGSYHLDLDAGAGGGTGAGVYVVAFPADEPNSLVVWNGSTTHVEVRRGAGWWKSTGWLIASSFSSPRPVVVVQVPEFLEVTLPTYAREFSLALSFVEATGLSGRPLAMDVVDVSGGGDVRLEVEVDPLLPRGTPGMLRLTVLSPAGGKWPSAFNASLAIRTGWGDGDSVSDEVHELGVAVFVKLVDLSPPPVPVPAVALLVVVGLLGTALFVTRAYEHVTLARLGRAGEKQVREL
ncbi:MAG: hypothetical protein Kow0069_22700 [Promethearchaeota archaeon]